MEAGQQTGFRAGEISDAIHKSQRCISVVEIGKIVPSNGGDHVGAFRHSLKDQSIEITMRWISA